MGNEYATFHAARFTRKLSISGIFNQTQDTVAMATKPNNENEDRSAWLLYDGNCPFCSRYVKLIRLRSSIGELELINARYPSEQLDEVQKAGLDVNEGMVLKFGQQLYHGADCIHMLALLSSPIDSANKTNAWLFRSPTRARLLYPWLRCARNMVLFALGRSKI